MAGMLYTGIDLGQAQDFAALVVVEQHPRFTPEVMAAQEKEEKKAKEEGKKAKPMLRRKWRYDVRHIQSWELGTGYTVIVDDVTGLFDAPPLLRTRIAADYTGVGRPVVDQLRAASIQAHLVPILVTGGNRATFDDDTRAWHVPKPEIVSTMVALMHSNLVQVSNGIEPKMLARLKREMADFKTKISRRSATEQFGAWQDGQHDDIIFSLMIAIWLAEKLGSASLSNSTASTSRGKSQSAIDTMPTGVFEGSN